MGNENEIYAVIRFIKRYDYDGACEILDILKEETTQVYQLIRSCQRSLNFNFVEAKQLTDKLDEALLDRYPGIRRYIKELPDLISGRPNDIFNELMVNLMIQLEREEYTDFLGRIFQLREMLYKYAVIQFRERKDYSLRDRIYQKKVFEGHFRIHHGMMNGIRDILRTGGGRWQKVVNVLSGRQMSDLMDLRHRTIVAHGIETVALRDIQRIYGSADHVLQDLFQVFEYLNIPVRPHKYKILNDEVFQLF